MAGGHNTTNALNNATGLWFKFDDRSVSEIDENSLVGPDCVALMYQRRSLRGEMVQVIPKEKRYGKKPHN
jgi:hypothetical protein